ncbi:MAG: hypothetical protein M1823_003092 [Watsoniomyces obsoletus]|nr:MAG: hypothetical protein M1823_003092 [Watsoniomyces obsoletus]
MTTAVKETVNTILDKLHLSSGEGRAAPPEPTAEQLQELRDIYSKAHQDHVFTFWDSLSSAEKGTLYESLSGFDPGYVNDIVKKALNAPPASKDVTLEPLPDTVTASIMDSPADKLQEWQASGLHLIAQNQVAVILMAGGQGTRLGSSAPKGCFNIDLPSQKSLFQIQAERIFRLQEMAKKQHGVESAVVPWYVMTSGPTRAPTEKFFEEHHYFKLKKENIIIFEQGVLPCVSNDGKILLESKSKIAVAPDGNGGIYRALIASAVMEDMRRRGIQHIHAYCVDNCLVRVADPVFIGFAAAKDVDVATKVVRKRNARESVGLVVLKNGKPDVVEYSEIDQATAEAQDAGQPDLLKFRAANIVNHYYSYRFLDSIPEWAHLLPHHVARKKIPYVDLSSGATVKPEKPNGIKLEQFVFDVFPRIPLEKFACMEVRREDEFSPLKNAKGTGEDDPDTSRAHVLQQGRRFVEAAGAVVESETMESAGVEVSPLISYAGEELEYLQGRTIKAPAVIERVED